jgi:hypothetical protein
MRTALLMACGAFVGLISPVMAADPIPTTADALQKRLATYDPRALAAAKHYYEQPAMKATLIATINAMTKTIFPMIAQQYPNLTPQGQAKLQQIIEDVMNARLDILEEISEVAMLDTLSTDEIVAWDKFASSPVGASILSKTPNMVQDVSSSMQPFGLDTAAAVDAEIKANAAELH